MTMSLGSYTFDTDPQDCTPPIEERRCKDIKTLGGVAFFSWGLYISGQVIKLKWPACSTDQYNNLRDLLLADEQIEWDLDAGDSSSGPTNYNVEIKSLKGDFHMSRKAWASYRKNVEIEFIIMSEV
jgi:hypothetical protein